MMNFYISVSEAMLWFYRTKPQQLQRAKIKFFGGIMENKDGKASILLKRNLNTSNENLSY
jgi:hypothetical protein